jgi:hypothetical protein
LKYAQHGLELLIKPSTDIKNDSNNVIAPGLQPLWSMHQSGKTAILLIKM